MARSPRRNLFKVTAKREQDLIELGGLLCSHEEVAVVMDLELAAITEALEAKGKAAKAFNKGRAEAVKALRRSQLKLAETSVTMAIFLGKAELGQGDRRELDQSGVIDLAEAGRKAEERLAALIDVAPEDDADQAGRGIQSAS